MQYNPDPPTDITTWGDLLCALHKLSAEQLAQPAQIVKEHPCADKVISAKPVVAIGTVDTLDLRYVRSCKDNRRHGDEIVLLVDGNPYGKDGAVAHRWIGRDETSGKLDSSPIYPKDYTPDQNWTGPAQKLADKVAPLKPLDETAWIGPIVKHRMRAYEESK